MKAEKKTTRNPWAWVSTLYFAEGIPYVVVMTVSVIMYKRLGISNTDIALYTSWLYLPWVIKPLWSPFVDMFRTKRFWIVTMQLFIGGALASVALTIPLPAFFQYTLAVFWLMAFSSATHDIAADGFYMLALEQHAQAAFTGVRSTFYRIAMITGQGLLVVLAGTMETSSSLPADEVTVQAVEAVESRVLFAPDTVAANADSGELRLLTPSRSVRIPLSRQPKAAADSLLGLAKQWNLQHGFRLAEEKKSASEPNWLQQRLIGPFEGFLRDHLGGTKGVVASSALKGNIGFIYLHLSRPPASTAPLAVRYVKRSGDDNIKLVEGERLSFTGDNWKTPAIVVVQLDDNLKSMTSASFVAQSGNIPLAWSVTFIVLAVLFSGFFVYHRFILPYPVADKPVLTSASRGVLQEFLATFVLFFKKKDILAILAFLLLYRFAEAQLVKLVSPFLLDVRAKGGLGLTTTEVGIVYGTVGIIALTCGGLLGGYVVSRRGMKYWLWTMVLVIHLPDAMFIYLSQFQPENLLVINLAVACEQFGYGFGFTAYMLFMILVSEGEHKTAHYAICTGFMALGMMIPGMFSGWLQEVIGYQHFFVWVIISTIPGFIVAALVKIPPEFGKKRG